ncbi:hypothetical protein LCGC14_0671410 [marine sediment metagenome]|uniref:Fibronectin type-III domain-containing protein n=1 Tax=marine sediment metagenome TaxID=412755 RepID=A0A0F9TC67_9ZZZZ
MGIKIDSFESGDNLGIRVFSATWKAMTFTASQSYNITAVKLWSKRKNSCGDATVSIRAVDGDGKPTGADLADKTVLEANLPIISTWIEFLFGTPYALVSGTKYAIVVRTSSGDLSNYLLWYGTSTNLSPDVQHIHSTDSGSSWTVSDTRDYDFQTFDDTDLPGKPTVPSPANAASSITLDETPLSWDASDPAADTYEVYFRELGDTWSLVGVAQAGVEWTIDFGTLDYGITYEWRIDATNAAGTTTGDTWSFDTLNFDQIRISYRLISGGNGNGPYDSPPGVQGTDWEYTGESNTITVKRLIAAANSTIWYESI